MQYNRKLDFQIPQMSLAKIIILTSVFLLGEVAAQIAVALNTTDIVISNSTTLAPDPYFDLIYPSDYLTFIAFTSSTIWTLSHNNTVQILNKTNPSLNLNPITHTSLDFLFQSTVPLSMIIFDQSYSRGAVTGFVNSCLVYYLYDCSNAFLPVLTRTITLSNITAPATSFIAGSTLYSFFSNQNSNDTILGVDIFNDSTVTITLPSSSASLAVSPNRKYALVLYENSKAQIYSVPNFTLLYTYYASISLQSATEPVSFSTDGTLALIQSDNHYRVVVFNLTSFSVLQSISANGIIESADFLDTGNRYILVVQNSKTQAYDIQLNIFSQFNATLQKDQLLVDHNSSQMVVALNNVRYIADIDISGNSSLAGPASQVNSSSNGNLTENVTATNTTNTDNQNASESNPSSNVSPRHMSYLLNLSQAQNQTFAGLQYASAVVLQVMTSFNLVVFSSPFVCFFLGFFNYFTLNSLYILLNIQLPDIIFKELSALFASSNANLLTSFGISFSLAPLTHELIDSPRALYFGVSSDLPSSNYYPFGLVLVNSLLFELILAIRRKLPRTHLAYSLLDFNRHKIYFGLAVYLMVGLLLPSQFVLTRRLSDWSTVANSAVQCLLYVVITQFLWSSLVEALSGNKAKKAKQKSKEGKKVQKKWKEQLPEWMIAFQNLLYPLLVLLPSPSFFLAAVLISKISEIVVFSRHSHERGVSRALQIGSFFCQVIYHCTFIVFSLTRRLEIIIYNSIFCLIFFYLGVLLNLAWTVLFFVKLLIKIVKAKKQINQIADNSLPLAKLRFLKKKINPPQTILVQMPMAPKIQPIVPEPVPVDPIRKAFSRIKFKRRQLFWGRVVDI